MVLRHSCTHTAPVRRCLPTIATLGQQLTADGPNIAVGVMKHPQADVDGGRPHLRSPSQRFPDSLPRLRRQDPPRRHGLVDQLSKLATVHDHMMPSPGTDLRRRIPTSAAATCDVERPGVAYGRDGMGVSIGFWAEAGDREAVMMVSRTADHPLGIAHAPEAPLGAVRGPGEPAVMSGPAGRFLRRHPSAEPAIPRGSPNRSVVTGRRYTPSRDHRCADPRCADVPRPGLAGQREPAAASARRPIGG